MFAVDQGQIGTFVWVCKHEWISYKLKHFYVKLELGILSVSDFTPKTRREGPQGGDTSTCYRRLRPQCLRETHLFIK